jgi:hypothetical protein
MLTRAVVIVFAVAVSLLGLLLVRRFVPADRLARHTDVAGYVYAVIGVLYAVILAQVVVAAWEEYRDAREGAAAEANAVLNLARLSEFWSENDRTAVEAALTAYATHVIDVEWSDMRRNDYDSASHTALMHRLWQVVNAAGQTPQAAGSTYSAAVDQLDQLDTARRNRVLLGEDGLPTMMTLTLILGAVVTVGFSYLFAVDDVWVHGLMTSSLAVLIALLLLLAYELETPFAGFASVEPTAMEFALNEIEFVIDASGDNP